MALEKLERVIHKFLDVVGVISAIVMILMMFYVMADAVMRLFKHSFVGSNELIINVIIIVVFFAIGRTCAEDAQIKIDVFTFLPKLDHITLCLSSFMLIFAGVAAFSQAALAYEMSIASTFLMIPRWPFLIIAGIGLILGGLGTFCVELRFIVARHNLHLQEKQEAEEVSSS